MRTGLALVQCLSGKRAPLDKDQQSKLAKDEGAWVKKRGDCKSDTSCIATAYRSRIDELTR